MTRPHRILVVDDNFTGVLLVRSVLELEGFVVDSADSSDEVMERLKDHLPNLILMDIQLPGQDGLSLTRQLKADPVLTTIPVVALTARAMAGDRELCLAAGCSGYITKPINTRTMVGEIERFLPSFS